MVMRSLGSDRQVGCDFANRWCESVEIDVPFDKLQGLTLALSESFHVSSSTWNLLSIKRTIAWTASTSSLPVAITLSEER